MCPHPHLGIQRQTLAPPDPDPDHALLRLRAVTKRNNEIIKEGTMFQMARKGDNDVGHLGNMPGFQICRLQYPQCPSHELTSLTFIQA